MVNLGIVVVNYRTPGDLRKFLDSYQLVERDVSGLVVVDVDPVDPVKEWVEGVPVITLTDNLGYATACNMGAQLLELFEGCEHLDAYGFFNADVAFLPDSVSLCMETMFSDINIAVVGPRQTNSAGQITSAGVTPTGRGGCQPRGWKQRDRGQFSEVADMMTVSGSAYFVRAQAWDELESCPKFLDADPFARGAFLQTPHYFEETWVSYHARAHGWRVVYDGRAHMIHEWHRASPLGGHADKKFKESQAMFRHACDLHGIEHD